MKTKMKTQGSTELPRFAVGALAIAGASAANAATVQITFTGSFISSTSGNNIDADFGNDGSAEIIGFTRGSGVIVAAAGGDTLGYALGYRLGQSEVALVGVGNTTSWATAVGGAAASARGLVAVSFTDTSIRSGLLTTGYLDMTASATHPGEKRITVNRLIFDEDTGGAITGLNVNNTYETYTLSAVPEPGSNLALLALGAGGLTLRRRLKRAA